MTDTKKSELIDWTEIPDGETWELFANDYLAALGFVIDIGPSRGPDAGKDLLVSEQRTGICSSQKFTWLVSNKHYATSNKAIGTGIEKDILDRVQQHNADGFMGFYSTPPSSALITRLEALKSNHSIRDYTIVQPRIIENSFVSGNLSKLVYRYFHNSYNELRPIQAYMDEYKALNCKNCGRDLLVWSVSEPFKALIAHVYDKSEYDVVEDIYLACKGDCDRRIESRLQSAGKMTSWWDISDLVNPVNFLKDILFRLDELQNSERKYSDEAFKKLKVFYIALSQRTLREVTDQDMGRGSFAEW